MQIKLRKGNIKKGIETEQILVQGILGNPGISVPGIQLNIPFIKRKL